MTLRVKGLHAVTDPFRHFFHIAHIQEAFCYFRERFLQTFRCIYAFSDFIVKPPLLIQIIPDIAFRAGNCLA